jgi:PASTA domain
MPERWEREVAKLGTLTAPRSVPSRISAGPHGDEMPPAAQPRRRIIAAVVGFAVFVAAAVLVAGAFRDQRLITSPSSGAAVLTASLDAPPDGSIPSLSLSTEDTSDRFSATDGKWPGVDLSPSPVQSFEGSIEPGTKLEVDGDANDIEGRLFVVDADGNETGESIPLSLGSGGTSLPGFAGYFRLTLVGTWPEGEAGFSVGITIGTPPADWPPPPGTAVVPDVIGLGKHEAVGQLIDAGFDVVSVANPAGETAGVVASQDPRPGTRIETTTVINLRMSASG